jgi:hypothetical protein
MPIPLLVAAEEIASVAEIFNTLAGTVENSKKTTKEFAKYCAEAAQLADKEALSVAQLSMNVGDHTAELEKLALAKCQSTRYSKEELLASMATLSAHKLNSEQIQELIPVITDYAAISGKGLVDTANAFADAIENGSTKSLAEFGVKLNTTGSSQLILNDLLKEGQRDANKYAEQVSQIGDGHLVELKNSFTAIKTEIGKDISPIINMWAEGFKVYSNGILNHVLPALESWGRGIKDLLGIPSTKSLGQNIQEQINTKQAKLNMLPQKFDTAAENRLQSDHSLLGISLLNNYHNGLIEAEKLRSEIANLKKNNSYVLSENKNGGSLPEKEVNKLSNKQPGNNTSKENAQAHLMAIREAHAQEQSEAATYYSAQIDNLKAQGGKELQILQIQEQNEITVKANIIKNKELREKTILEVHGKYAALEKAQTEKDATDKLNRQKQEEAEVTRIQIQSLKAQGGKEHEILALQRQQQRSEATNKIKDAKELAKALEAIQNQYVADINKLDAKAAADKKNQKKDEDTKGIENKQKAIEKFGQASVFNVSKQIKAQKDLIKTIKDSSLSEEEKAQKTETAEARLSEIKKESTTNTLNTASTVLGSMSDVANAVHADAATKKGIAMGQAAINTALAATKALDGPPILNWIQFGAVIASGLAQQAIISQQKFALGTNYAPGGMSLVGEQGPELVNLPRGSQVYTNSQTSQMLGSNGNTHFHIYNERGDLAQEIITQTRKGGSMERAAKLLVAAAGIRG